MRRVKVTGGSFRVAIGRHILWLSPLASAVVYFLLGHVLPYLPHTSVDRIVGPIYGDLLHGLKLSAPYVATLLLMPLPAGFLIRWRRRRSAGRPAQAGDTKDCENRSGA